MCWNTSRKTRRCWRRCTGPASRAGHRADRSQHRWLWSRVDDFAHHRRRYTRAELAGKVARAGFRVEYATSFVSLLLPLMLASRGMKKSGANMDEQMEAVGLKVGRLTNAVLRVIMRIEQGLIRLGLSLPLGGSLLLVARKT